jgi:hypothetical protein
LGKMGWVGRLAKIFDWGQGAQWEL